MRLVKTPNLPQGKVRAVIGGSLLKPYEAALNKLGIKVFYSYDNERFDTALKSHADLFVNYLGEGRIILDNSQKRLENELKNLGLSVDSSDLNVGPDYPSDCALNCVLTDDIIICNESVTDTKLLQWAHDRGLKTVNVRQGYCKCSVAVVDKNAFITDDIGIFDALKSVKKDVLLAEKGSVALKGFNYGFIGGCSGKIARDMIAFFGDITKHKSYTDIKCFLNNYNIEAVSLSEDRLTDVGSIIPITEK